MASCKKIDLPQEGTSGNTAGESLGASASCPSYSGGGNMRQEESLVLGGVKGGKVLGVRLERLDCVRPQRDSSGRFRRNPFRGLSGTSLIVSDDSVEVPDSDDTGSVTSMESSLDRRGGGVHRKRPASSVLAPGRLCSGSEAEGVAAAKVNTARRGKARPAGVPPRDAYARPRTTPDETLEEVLRRRPFRRPAAEGSDPAMSTGSESGAAAIAGDPSTMDAQQLRARAGENVARILEVASKSKNLKGEFIARLKRSASELSEVVDTLAGRTEKEETRLLRAENRCLRLDVESLKAEVKALRSAFVEAKASAAAAATSAAAKDAMPAPSTILGAEVVEELRRSLISTIGQMLNARFDGIQDRLLPAPVLRPPLKADARRAATDTAPPAVPAPKPARIPAPSVGGGAGGAKAAAATVAPAPVITVPATVPQVETWATVVRKGKGKGKGKGTAPPPAAKKKAPAPVARAKAPTTIGAKAKAPTTSGARAATTPAAPKRRRKAPARPPATAAVVLTLRPEAAEEGVTYMRVIQRAQDEVDIDALEIDHISFRRTATGARMLEVSGPDMDEKADKLAEKLREIVSEVAVVARPVKSVDLRITGMDDGATREAVEKAVAEAGSCATQKVKAGMINPGFNGAGSVRVSCPVEAAERLLKKGRLRIGWSTVRVYNLGVRPMRCHRCMGLGHTRIQCPASADRGDLCFRCGNAGHRAAECRRADPRCAICAESGRPSGHVMGGRSCVPPRTRGKVKLTTPLVGGVRYSFGREAGMSE